MFVGAPQTFATNGYFTHGNGTKNKGMAGAGIATPEEAMAISNNPASALLVGNRIEVGASLFNPNRSYSTTPSLLNGAMGTLTIGPNNLSSAREYFGIPHVAMTRQLNDVSAWGFAFYGHGGMNTKWEGGSITTDPDGPGPAPILNLPGTYGAGTAGVDLSQAFLDLTYARKFSDKLSVGLSAVLVAQVFEAQGLGLFAGYTESFVNNFFTTGMPDPSVVTNLTNNGHDNSTGFGFKVGVNSQLTDSIALALMYRTEVDMSEFDSYSDLFANNGDFDIPANAKFGLSFKANDKVTLSTDVEHTWFSKIAAISNPIANLFTCPTVNPASTSAAGCLGGANGAGFGWSDMTVVKLGAQVKTKGDWTWRVGYSHSNHPIDKSEVLFNILAPAVINDHLSVGFTKDFGPKRELNVAFTKALSGSARGANPFDPTQDIVMSMDQNDLEVSYTWKL